MWASSWSDPQPRASSSTERPGVKVVIAGGTGSLGSQLQRVLRARDHDVVVLTRGSERLLNGVRHVHWDGATRGPWASELGDADTVINLAGKLVDCRPTRRNIELLTSSRVNATRILVEALAHRPAPLPVFLQSSTTAIYGEQGSDPLTEDDPIGIRPPQMVEVASAWEASIHGVNAAHLTILRSSIVLQPDSPAMNRLTLLARLGAAGTIGNGRQWLSWIHIDDWTRLILTGLSAALPTGIVNTTSPNPVTNKEFMAALREACDARVGLPTPAPLVTLGGWLLGTDPALALTGRRVTSTHLPTDEFIFPKIRQALTDVCQQQAMSE